MEPNGHLTKKKKCAQFLFCFCFLLYTLTDKISQEENRSSACMSSTTPTACR